MVSHLMSGGIEVICGPMFSGKTEELIRRTRRAEIARQKVQIFKAGIDDRYDPKKVVSHSSQWVDAQPVDSSQLLLKSVRDATRVIGIDEVQFFDWGIIEVVHKLATRGLRVIIAGLDLDSEGRPFGAMPYLLALADQVTKIQAICTICGLPATKTHRKASEEGQVLVGEKDLYEARCRHHIESENTIDLTLFRDYQMEKPKIKPSARQELN